MNATTLTHVAVVRETRMDKRLRAALFATVLLFSGCATPPREAQAQAGAPFSFAPLVKRVVPAVVNIAVIEGGQAAIPIPPELRGTPAERMLRDRLRRQSVR